MSTIYDLHSHSLHSDGTLTPTDLVGRARAQGVEVLALTDHDTTQGLVEAAAAAQRAGIKLVPGVEISVTWGKRTVHIVGLNIDVDHPSLQAGLAEIRLRRAERARSIGERLARTGIEGAYAGAAALAQGELITRTHFGRYLVSAGHAKDMGQAFKRYLSQGKRGYAPVQWASLEEAVNWINDAGGQAIIAHPGRYRLGSAKLRTFLAEFRDLGGAAIEVVCGSHNETDCARFARLASEHELLASVGSDFHAPKGGPGFGNAWVELGRLRGLPEGSIPVWHNW